MIGYIRGIFHPQSDGTVIVENSSGIGFLLNIPSGSAIYKMPEGSEVKVFTSMQVREDDISLYGFSEKEDLELFELLIKVSGVGAKMAISIMSTLPGVTLRQAIASGDSASIVKAPGVGKKTAERIIIDLKDKVGLFAGGDVIASDIFDENMGDTRTEAVSALMALGYSRNEATSVIAKIKGDNLTVEDYIKQALKSL